jgi:hypothetical protein
MLPGTFRSSAKSPFRKDCGGTARGAASFRSGCRKLQPLRSFLAHGLRRSHSFFGNSFWQTLYLQSTVLESEIRGQGHSQTEFGNEKKSRSSSLRLFPLVTKLQPRKPREQGTLEMQSQFGREEQSSV